MTPRGKFLDGFVGRSLLLAMTALCALPVPAAADEGLWLFNQFPKDALKQKYDFDVTDEFLGHLRLATVRLGGGSGASVSGAFVSDNGLILTSYRNAAQ